MCGRALVAQNWELQQDLKVPVVSDGQEKLKERTSDDIAPTDMAPVITHHQPRIIQHMRWGLIPANAVDPKLLKPMYNARAETILEKSSFKDLVMRFRCLSLNTGYYEWSEVGDDKIQWSITPETEKYFYLAGLWSVWKDRSTGELVKSFTIVTCASSEKMQEYHKRMPVILNKAERRLWMSADATQEQLLSLFKPCTDDMYRVSEYERKPIKEKKTKKKEIKVSNNKPDDNSLFS